MVYIKKIVMEGFKSFAKKTEVLFDRGINVILGPNGSGKSNISDALCFVLGRLSIKSMRAAKAKNLIFMGSKYVKPAREASVELVFDNSERTFGIDRDEISIMRAVRRNGQGIYKINGEVKTREEIIELLNHAGIDAYGFNLILQGQIQSIVKTHPEDRRKIIEDVAGISVYESRKEKSLHELEKTDEKLKEISAVLRERTAYLKNLEHERAQALRFQELQTTVKRCKASIIGKKIEEKRKELGSVIKSIEEKSGEREKTRKQAEEISKDIESLTEKINQINKHIQRATGIEQETLHNQIANLKAEVEGLRVRRESYENRKGDIETRIEEMKKNIPEFENEIKEMKEKSPLIAKKSQELKKKKDELSILEDERKKILTLKNELNSIKERVKDKDRQVARVSAESSEILRQLEIDSSKLEYKDEKECNSAITFLNKKIGEFRINLEMLSKSEMVNIKIASVSEAEIQNAEKTKKDVEGIDICPLCQSKITGEHVKHVCASSDIKINDAKDKIEVSNSEIKRLKNEKTKIEDELKSVREKVSAAEMEMLAHSRIKERKEQLKKFVEEEKIVKGEQQILEERRKTLESKAFDFANIEEKYAAKMLEVEEISSRTEKDIDNALLYKERDLDGLKNAIKRSTSDLDDMENEINDLTEAYEEKIAHLAEKEEQERKLNEGFKKLFLERDGSQKDAQERNLLLSDKQGEGRQIEEQINYLKIGKARLDAEAEALGMELTEFAGAEIIQGSMNAIEERLEKTQQTLMQIGSINMRALEVWEGIKQEYDLIKGKADTIEKEKLDILSIIEEIDKKKKREFMKTFRAINELFTTNFSTLYNKGIAYLDVENKEDIFAGGVNIVVKLAKGKYFDVTSLSGGEQTLVALSLLFAIQEYKPYHFYVFDEIDAALDKRNSERLAGLLKRYMKGGQYIVVTHNDAIITESDVLYGVSMHEGVSKVLSLNIKDDNKAVNNMTPVETGQELKPEPVQDGLQQVVEGVIEEELKSDSNLSQVQ